MSNNSNNAPRLTITNTSVYQPSHPNTTTTATIPITRSTIDDFREIVREQSFITPNNSDHNSIDVPVKKYPPLPDITVPYNSSMNNNNNNNTFFRTETILASPKQTHSKKQVFNHFASTQRGTLPALHKSYASSTMSNIMDLDEDLPQCNIDTKHRAATYTSPGDRIVSPIKRPSAPLPPTSAQIKRPGQNIFVGGGDEEQDDEYYSNEEDDDSQLFEAHFRQYQQPVIMPNRRIDHYSNKNRHVGKHPTIVINGEHTESTHPMDSIEFEP
ncbi:unnamed protein product [Adineta steineri]|uniref:Uncharacterized protein n=1 Tax=Adineta steineri TaxID=433720 RepID=A0A815AWC5_9BILA|nr:unnamed protein product [Adineta steineri]CAF1552098.1 unnamed protein product [Adineta steineri]